MTANGATAIGAGPLELVELVTRTQFDCKWLPIKHFRSALVPISGFHGTSAIGRRPFVPVAGSLSAVLSTDLRWEKIPGAISRFLELSARPALESFILRHLGANYVRVTYFVRRFGLKTSCIRMAALSKRFHLA